MMEATLRRWVKTTLVALAVVGVIVFLVAIGDLVKLVIISALLAYILDPLVTLIESNGINRTPATAILFAAIALILGLILILLMPLISAELFDMSNGIDPEKVKQAFARLDNSIKEALSFLGIPDLHLSDRLADTVIQFGNSLFSNLFDVFSIFTNMVLTPFIVFFLLKDSRSIKKYFISLVPNRYFELTCNLIYKMDVQLGNYLRGQILDALVVGILSISALWLLDVKNAFFIGTFAGIANVIPYIGPLCGAVLGVGLSLLETGDLMFAFYIALAFGVVQLIDNAVLQPNIVARNVDLPPLAVLLVVIIGGKFFGILGMLLSVPVTAIVKVFLQEGIHIYRQYHFT